MDVVVATVSPIFGLILLGYAAARFKWVSDAAAKGLGEFTFLIAMPALLFRAVATADIAQTRPLELLASYVLAVALIWLIATAVSTYVLRQPPVEGAVFAMTASYGNIVLLGIPIALSAYGPAAAPTAAVVVSMHIATLWLAACLHLALAGSRPRRFASRASCGKCSSSSPATRSSSPFWPACCGGRPAWASGPSSTACWCC